MSNAEQGQEGPGRDGGPDGLGVGGRGKRLRPSGGYRKLRSFQVATTSTTARCRFAIGSWTSVRQARPDGAGARSGGKNIAEGSRAAATTSQTELRLVNVARASLEELLLDYEDYLRQHGHRQWDKKDPEALAVRVVGRRLDQSDQPDKADPVAHWKAYTPGWNTPTRR